MPSMNPMNEAALHYWKAHCYSQDDILSLCRELGDSRLIGLIRFLPDRVLDVNFSNHMAKSKEGHPYAWSKYFRHVATRWLGAPLIGTVGIWADDAVWSFYQHFTKRAPFVAFGRTAPDRHTFLVPDPAFMNAEGYREKKLEIDTFESQLPFKEKTNIAFWRGANSDLGSGRQGYENGPRIRLCMMSKAIADNSLLDAGLSKINSYGNEEYKKKIEALEIQKGYVPFDEFFQHRFQIDVDGMHCAWISCFAKLYSKCCLLKVESTNEQWYYHRMIPWKHYIPISSDFEGLKEQLLWCQEHTDLCEEIGLEGHRLANSISYEESLDETGMMLSELFKFQQA